MLYLNKKIVAIGAMLQELYEILRFLIFEPKGLRIFANTAHNRIQFLETK